MQGARGGRRSALTRTIHTFWSHAGGPGGGGLLNRFAPAPRGPDCPTAGKPPHLVASSAGLHGAAFGIVGKDQASLASMEAAIRLAAQLAFAAG